MATPFLFIQPCLIQDQLDNFSAHRNYLTPDFEIVSYHLQEEISMQSNRHYRWWTVALLAVLTLVGCAPRVGQGTTAAQEGTEQLAVDLPALVIDIDAAGTPTVGGAPLAALGAAFGVAGLDAVTLTPQQVETLTAANIQHLQINNLPDGLKLLVNGQEIPTVSWDVDSLTALQGLSSQLGEGVPPVLQQLLPALGKVGVGVTVRLPLAQGAEMIPLEATGAVTATAQTTDQTFLESVGVAPRLNIPVTYAADGSWTVGGLTDTEWVAVSGQSFWESLRLPADTIATLTGAGVTEMVVSTDPEGIHLSVNGQQLPFINWGEGKLAYALNLAAQAGLLGDLGGGDTEAVAGAVESLLPIVTGSEVEIHVLLPQ
jgi:hypothetical protein